MQPFAAKLRAVLITSLLLASVTAMAAGGYQVYRTDSAFEDVLDGLKAAIQERGMYINNVMDMGVMLERTGKDLGTPDPIYAKAQSVEFCSAVLSRAMLQEDPTRIVNCPFIISVYERHDERGITYLVHRTIPMEERTASPIMARIATTYEELAESAIAW
ncbi:hypothetical protein ThidrDRAFT_4175 [Thiorhodococcus drewsii AZ1]|uniref:Uncharacterized protein n=1 Tax=Thiorhodococcus drewsii AZ1 TaxID=765913 RepID=G2E7B2_9GAMM|nr:DUF302 domain-containing protein [Thiorhodococcus drewsii]EGV28018.1 hypothetical protein ThidrDRAFT_4175 [Thiorhodococcus drewsii AZ1]